MSSRAGSPREAWTTRVPSSTKAATGSLYFEDPEGNVVEAWDFFEHGDGGRDGVDALR